MKKNMSHINNSSHHVDVKALILAIERARQELQNCMDYFQNVSNEPNLIDYAIYREAAVRAKYTYLLMQARKLDIKVNEYDACSEKISS
ncbi:MULTISPECIES: DUF2508 family protein [Clostridium]|uniref:DUF2508 family protein n=1 Tax=Clostridium TaxID=1485 RepID=UPI0008251E4A|nr:MULTISPECIES: DUF2508 family protein [Clostridium]PJI08258.1 DUF2508 domain-containing protein [Clostridium sp. CT7]